MSSLQNKIRKIVDDFRREYAVPNSLIVDDYEHNLLEELGKVAQKIETVIKDTKVDILAMFCYQGPPSKHWIETKGQFWMGWNEACEKILEKVEGLLVEKVEGEK